LAGLDSIPKLASFDSKYDLFILDNEFNITMVYVRKGGVLIVKLLGGETKRESIVETLEEYSNCSHALHGTKGMPLY
jgi:hypothetical protein